MTTEKSADDAVLMDDVFGSGRDRAGKDAPATEPEAKAKPETVAEPKGKEPATEPQAEQPSEADPKGYRDPATGRFVPLKELTTEREKRQAAEREREELARLRKEDADRIAAMERRFAEFERSQRQAPAQPQQPPPDPNLDPAGALAYERQQIQMQMLNQRLNFSEMRAQDKFGEQAVREALSAANAAGVITDQWVTRSRDFYGELMQWHKQQQILQRVGADPEAYEKSIEEKIRAKVLEELKSGNRAVLPGQTPAPQAAPQFPGSLADATAAGTPVGSPANDEAVMGSVSPLGESAGKPRLSRFVIVNP